MRLTGEPRDAGFTLIELLIVVAILGVIAIPLSNMMIAYLRNSDAASARMVLSHDAQISAAYVARDVASVGLRDLSAAPGPGGTIAFKDSIQLDAAFDAGGLVCGTSATPTALIRLLGDYWDTSTSPATPGTRIAAYYLAPKGAVSELHRLLCVGTTSTDVVVAHNVDPATVTVTCSGPTTCDGTPVPQAVTVAFTVTMPAADPYPITLTGHRRQQ
jgi:prepilin-type N-terminal cleavage/methylation domain-containing protein